jgi:hypothetical protein
VQAVAVAVAVGRSLETLINFLDLSRKKLFMEENVIDLLLIMMMHGFSLKSLI